MNTPTRTALAFLGGLVVGAAAAAASGMAAAADPALERVLPREFLGLGMRTHRAFDRMAGALAAGGGRDTALAHLARVTSACVACHALYRLEGR